ncbi:uncharacterized protein [Palaemon carinicauda]|uniref:uncharacterized protein n=1 Tax=Palaemon carinicauda TaxID=392227 RepID=UPI0035B5C833
MASEYDPLARTRHSESEEDIGHAWCPAEGDHGKCTAYLAQVISDDQDSLDEDGSDHDFQGLGKVVDRLEETSKEGEREDDNIEVGEWGFPAMARLTPHLPPSPPSLNLTLSATEECRYDLFIENGVHVTRDISRQTPSFVRFADSDVIQEDSSTVTHLNDDDVTSYRSTLCIVESEDTLFINEKETEGENDVICGSIDKSDQLISTPRGTKSYETLLKKDESSAAQTRDDISDIMGDSGLEKNEANELFIANSHIGSTDVASLIMPATSHVTEVSQIGKRDLTGSCDESSYSVNIVDETEQGDTFEDNSVESGTLDVAFCELPKGDDVQEVVTESPLRRQEQNDEERAEGPYPPGVPVEDSLNIAHSPVTVSDTKDAEMNNDGEGKEGKTDGEMNWEMHVHEGVDDEVINDKDGNDGIEVEEIRDYEDGNVGIGKDGLSVVGMKNEEIIYDRDGATGTVNETISKDGITEIENDVMSGNDGGNEDINKEEASGDEDRNEGIEEEEINNDKGGNKRKQNKEMNDYSEEEEAIGIDSLFEIDEEKSEHICCVSSNTSSPDSSSDTPITEGKKEHLSSMDFVQDDLENSYGSLQANLSVDDEMAAHRFPDTADVNDDKNSLEEIDECSVKSFINRDDFNMKEKGNGEITEESVINRPEIEENFMNENFVALSKRYEVKYVGLNNSEGDVENIENLVAEKGTHSSLDHNTECSNEETIGDDEFGLVNLFTKLDGNQPKETGISGDDHQDVIGTLVHDDHDPRVITFGETCVTEDRMGLSKRDNDVMSPSSSGRSKGMDLRASACDVGFVRTTTNTIVQGEECFTGQIGKGEAVSDSPWTNQGPENDFHLEGEDETAQTQDRGEINLTQFFSESEDAGECNEHYRTGQVTPHFFESVQSAAKCQSSSLFTPRDRSSFLATLLEGGDALSDGNLNTIECASELKDFCSEIVPKNSLEESECVGDRDSDNDGTVADKESEVIESEVERIESITSEDQCSGHQPNKEGYNLSTLDENQRVNGTFPEGGGLIDENLSDSIPTILEGPAPTIPEVPVISFSEVSELPIHEGQDAVIDKPADLPKVQDIPLAEDSGLSIAEASGLSIPEVQDIHIAENSNLSVAEASDLTIPEVQDIAVAEDSGLIIAEASDLPIPEVQDIPVADDSNLSVAEASDLPISEVQDILLAEDSNQSIAEASDLPIPRVQDIHITEDSNLSVAEASDFPIPEVQDIPVAEDSDVSIAEASDLPIPEVQDIPVGEDADLSIAEASDLPIPEVQDIPVGEDSDLSIAEASDLPIPEVQDIPVGEDSDLSIAEASDLPIPEVQDIPVGEDSDISIAEASDLPIPEVQDIHITEDSNLFVAEASDLPISEVQEIPVGEDSDLSIAEASDLPIPEVQDIHITEDSNLSVAEASDLPISEVQDIPVGEDSDLSIAEVSDLPIPEIQDIPVAEDSDLSIAEASDLPIPEVQYIPIGEDSDLSIAEASDLPIPEVQYIPIGEDSDLSIAEASDLPIPEVQDIPVGEDSALSIAEASDLPIPEVQDIPVAEDSDLSITEASDLPIPEFQNLPIAEDSDQAISGVTFLPLSEPENPSVSVSEISSLSISEQQSLFISEAQDLSLSVTQYCTPIPKSDAQDFDVNINSDLRTPCPVQGEIEQDVPVIILTSATETSPEEGKEDTDDSSLSLSDEDELVSSVITVIAADQFEPQIEEVEDIGDDSSVPSAVEHADCPSESEAVESEVLSDSSELVKDVPSNNLCFETDVSQISQLSEDSFSGWVNQVCSVFCQSDARFHDTEDRLIAAEKDNSASQVINEHPSKLLFPEKSDTSSPLPVVLNSDFSYLPPVTIPSEDCGIPSSVINTNYLSEEPEQCSNAVSLTGDIPENKPFVNEEETEVLSFSESVLRSVDDAINVSESNEEFRKERNYISSVTENQVDCISLAKDDPAVNENFVDLQLINENQDSGSLPVIESREERILPLDENQDDNISPFTENPEDNISPVNENQEDNILPVTENREDNISPVTEYQEGNISLVTENQTDNISPVTENQEDNISPVTENQDDNISPVTENQEDNISSVTESLEDDISPLTENQEDNTSPVTENQEDNTSPVTENQEGNISPLTENQEDNISSVFENQESVISRVIEYKEDDISFVTVNQAEGISRVTGNQENYISTLIENQENYVSNVIENQENNNSILTVNQEDRISPVIENQEDTISQVIDNQEDTISPVIDNQEDTISPVIDNQEDTISPVIDNQEDTISPVIDNQEDTISPVIDNQEERFSPACEKQEGRISPWTANQGAVENQEEFTSFMREDYVSEDQEDFSSQFDDSQVYYIPLVEEDQEYFNSLVTEDHEYSSDLVAEDHERSSSFLIEDRESTVDEDQVDFSLGDRGRLTKYISLVDKGEYNYDLSEFENEVNSLVIHCTTEDNNKNIPVPSATQVDLISDADYNPDVISSVDGHTKSTGSGENFSDVKTKDLEEINVVEDLSGFRGLSCKECQPGDVSFLTKPQDDNDNLLVEGQSGILGEVSDFETDDCGSFLSSENRNCSVKGREISHLEKEDSLCYFASSDKSEDNFTEVKDKLHQTESVVSQEDSFDFISEERDENVTSEEKESDAAYALSLQREVERIDFISGVIGGVKEGWRSVPSSAVEGKLHFDSFLSVIEEEDQIYSIPAGIDTDRTDSSPPAKALDISGEELRVPSVPREEEEGEGEEEGKERSREGKGRDGLLILATPGSYAGCVSYGVQGTIKIRNYQRTKKFLSWKQTVTMMILP